MKRIRPNDYLSTALILLFMVVLVYTTHLFSRVDNVLFDIGQKLYQSPAPADIVIVAIDENSLSQLGRWPIMKNTDFADRFDFAEFQYYSSA